MTFSKTDSVKLLADGLALIYHEARHARHLVNPGYLSAAGWEQLLSLPTNRVKAWKVIHPIRENAANAPTADKALDRFELRFGKNLANLRDLFANEHWKHASAVGGHAWRSITAAVNSLGEAIKRGYSDDIEGAAHSLLIAHHNNGLIRDKINELDSEVGFQTGPWWQNYTDT